MRLGLFITVCILIFVMVIIATGATVYQYRNDICFSNRNPWCYLDWNCDDNAGNPVPKTTIQTINQQCSPITADRAAALNARGCSNVYPGSNFPFCFPSTALGDGNCHPATQTPSGGTVTCPAYGQGDIDWTTCTGAGGL